MLNRILLIVLTALIVIGVGGYMLAGLNARSLDIAELARDACYSRHGFGFSGAGDMPEAVRTQCTRPIRDREAGLIWRAIFAASAGATAAMLVVGGIVIMLRRRSAS